MNIGATAKQPWDTVHLARYGALLGFLAAMIEQFCHAFWQHVPQGDLSTHVLVETADYLTDRYSERKEVAEEARRLAEAAMSHEVRAAE
jgi:hypothetical protein